jgi:segregation and condensation protein B
MIHQKASQTAVLEVEEEEVLEVREAPVLEDETPDPEDAIPVVEAEDASPEETAAARLAARAASFSDARVRTICESLLFVADRPLTPKAIQDATGLELGRIRDAMEAIAGEYREGVSGIVLHEVAGGWQLRTCPTSADEVRRFLQVKPQRLTRAALETLAIVAYRQPVTRPEVEEIRGVDCGAVLKALLERGLVQVIGKKEEPGRPLLYGSTKAFLEFFNLKDLSSLPTLREFHELNEESMQIVEESFPEEAEKGDRSIADLVERALSKDTEDSRDDDESALDDLDEAIREADSAAKAAGETLDGPARAAKARTDEVETVTELETAAQTASEDAAEPAAEIPPAAQAQEARESQG